VTATISTCACGCGGTTAIIKQTATKRGDIAGEPRRYIFGHQGRNAAKHRWATATPKDRRRNYRKSLGRLSHEQLSAAGREWFTRLTPEQAIARLAQMRLARDPVEHAETGRRMGEKFGYANGCKAGAKYGPINAKLQIGICSPELAGYGPHYRWHISRGIVNPKCGFCVAD
jgi:hypothetical protein